jgi:hypothetical protein
MIVLDDDATDEREQFRSVEDRGWSKAVPGRCHWEQRLHIFVCRDLKISLRDFGPSCACGCERTQTSLVGRDSVEPLKQFLV